MSADAMATAGTEHKSVEPPGPSSTEDRMAFLRTMFEELNHKIQNVCCAQINELADRLATLEQNFEVMVEAVGGGVVEDPEPDLDDTDLDLSDLRDLVDDGEERKVPERVQRSLSLPSNIAYPQRSRVEAPAVATRRNASNFRQTRSNQAYQQPQAQYRQSSRGQQGRSGWTSGRRTSSPWQ